jgi:hypothetical protein
LSYDSWLHGHPRLPLDAVSGALLSLYFVHPCICAPLSRAPLRLWRVRPVAASLTLRRRPWTDRGWRAGCARHGVVGRLVGAVQVRGPGNERAAAGVHVCGAGRAHRQPVLACQLGQCAAREAAAGQVRSPIWLLVLSLKARRGTRGLLVDPRGAFPCDATACVLQSSRTLAACAHCAKAGVLASTCAIQKTDVCGARACVCAVHRL